MAYYRHLQQKINHINTAHAGKVIALELHAAPMPATQRCSGHRRVCPFAERDYPWDWSCDLVLEHCDAMTGIAPRKGFLPLDNVLEVIAGYDISVCINWARSTIEGQNPPGAGPHAAGQTGWKTGRADVLRYHACGEYGEWQDLHAPFAPFCPQSLMTTDHARELFACAEAEPLQFLPVLNCWK